MDVLHSGLHVQTLWCPLALCPAADYKEVPFLTCRGGVSPGCSGRQLPCISSSVPFSGLSSFSHGSSCPQPIRVCLSLLAPHGEGSPGADNPRVPEAGAINGSASLQPLGEGKKQQRPLITQIVPARSLFFRRGFGRPHSFLALLLTAPMLRENQVHYRASLQPSRQGSGMPRATGQASGQVLEPGAATRGERGRGDSSGGALVAI